MDTKLARTSKKRKAPPPEAFRDLPTSIHPVRLGYNYSGKTQSNSPGNAKYYPQRAHCRRKYYEAAIAKNGESRANYALAQVRKLYQVESECKQMNELQRQFI